MISQNDYKAIFDLSPSAKLLIAPNPPLYTILDANNAYLEATHKTRPALLGKGLFEAFPPNPADPASKERASDSLDQALRTKKTHYLREYRYDVPLPGMDGYIECYWTTTNTPVLSADDEILYLIHAPENVTLDVKARQELMMSEERARLAIESNELGTFDIDCITGESVTSKRFADIFGTNTDSQRQDYINLIHPDDLSIRDNAYQQALETGRLFYEVRIVRPDTIIRWIKVEGKMLFDSNKKPLRIIGMIQDCTPEYEAKEQERKLITLVDNSVDLMSILQLDGTNSYINRAGMEMLGFDTVAQVKTTPITELHDPEDFKKVEKEVLPSVMGEGRWSGTMLVRNLKTKEIFPVLNNTIRIDDPVRGVPIAVGAVMRDLRPEIAAKLALSKSEMLLKTITTAAPTALWKCNEKGEIDYVNQTWLDWTGSTPEQNRTGWDQFLLQEDREKAINTFRTSIENRTDYEDEFRMPHKDGNIRWCLASGKPLYEEQGNFSGYVGACVDITEQKKLQEQKDDFLAIASHELKTPVTSIKAFIQVMEKMLLSKGLSTEAQFANKIDMQINKLIGLISDLLDVTKISTGKLQFNNSVFDLDILLSQVSDDLQYTFTTHKITKNLSAKGAVYGDKERMEQVIVNLITNAVKYSPQAKEIIIESSVKENEFHFQVKDFGIGIPPENLHNVFDQFFRVNHTEQHKFPGLGLGLYISSEIIKRQNGKIWVSSESGQGSTFGIAMPIHTVN